MTPEFDLGSLEDLTERQLILPKLYRRSVDYLADVRKGFRGTLEGWLEANLGLDDGVLVVTHRTALSRVLVAEGGRVRVTVDLLEAVFLEK